jgi:hypothetical protein
VVIVYNRGYLVLFIILLLAFATTPMWTGATGIGFVNIREELEKPEGDNCIESKDYMEAHHMELLNEFRSMAIREGIRIYKSEAYGGYFNASIYECFECHSYKEFCEKCHEFSGVHVYCLTCHAKPEE